MRRGLWGAATAASLLSLLSLLSLPLPAHADDLASARSAAQERANRAAARYDRAQSDLARAQAGVVDLQQRLQRDTAQLSALQGQVEKIALAEYMRGGTTPILLVDDVNKYTRAKAVFRYIAIGDVAALDRYRATRQDLSAARSKLESQLSSRQAAVRSVRAEQQAAVAELDRLAAQQRALDAKRAQQAASRAAASPRGSPPPTPAAGAPAAVAVTGSWVCPVQGPHSFTNDYGNPRGQGPHQGNDILSPRGTPVVANVAGNFQQHPNSRGGLAYFLNGSDGRQYYGAHLESFARGSGQVGIGTVIGYVGNTGDASGGPTHLHFEIHVGGVPTNPYPTLKQYC
jgi:murein DD-endopeptidase MepM/ murein hydrolase activator NlpD